jgi:hypothetical protein
VSGVCGVEHHNQPLPPRHQGWQRERHAVAEDVMLQHVMLRRENNHPRRLHARRRPTGRLPQVSIDAEGTDALVVEGMRRMISARRVALLGFEVNARGYWYAASTLKLELVPLHGRNLRLVPRRRQGDKPEGSTVPGKASVAQPGRLAWPGRLRLLLGGWR